jgi:4-amino-4-deoxy-L-arabinose transferase-like glycosyltransferase
VSSLAPTDRAAWARDLPLPAAVRRSAVPALIVLLALVLRLFHVEANGLRTDEMYSVWMANRPLPEMLSAIVLEGHDATPPVYYALLHGMLQVSTALWAIRLVSILAGAAMVWATYALAGQLLGARVAAVSALLLAVSPFSIEISQVARAYALTGALVIASLYCLVRLRAAHTPARYAWLFGLLTLAALATHYLAALVLVVENAIVFALAAARRLPRRKVLDWVKLQAVLGLLALPLAWMALQRVPNAPEGSGQSWLEGASVAVAIKSLIFYGTGDPSYGPTGLTLPRLASLAVIGGLLALGAWQAWRLWRSRPEARVEAGRVAFVAALFFGVWGLALGVSFVRPIFHQKYFLFLEPLLLILLVWAGLRLQPAVLGRGLLAGLAALTGLALGVYFTSPNGEQWREAMAHVRQAAEPGDYVVAAPGYYIRPISFYLRDEIPAPDYSVLRAPFVLIGPEGYRSADDAVEDRGLPDIDAAASQADRVWLVTGYAELDPERLSWFFEDYTVVERREYLGVTVVLGDRPDTASGAARQLFLPLATEAGP